MSTKIYNAYRLQPGADVFALRREVMAKFPTLLLRERAAALVLRATTTYNEQWSLTGERKDFEAVVRAELLDEIKAPEQPLTETTVMVFQNPVRGELYIKVYGALASVEHHEAILALDAVAEDFHYSTGSSAPEGFTRAQWQDRGLAWDEALDGAHDFMNTLGVQINLFSPFSARLDFERLRELGVVLPDRERQARELALNLCMQAAIGQEKGQNAVQAAWSRYLDWANDRIDKAPYMAEAHAILDVRPEPVLP